MSEPLWPTRDELKKLSDDELRKRHDYAVGEGHQSPTRADFYATELRHREFSRRERWMLAMTVAIAVMTLAVVGLTALSAWFVYRTDDSRAHQGRHEHVRSGR